MRVRARLVRGGYGYAHASERDRGQSRGRPWGGWHSRVCDAARVCDTAWPERMSYGLGGCDAA